MATKRLTVEDVRRIWEDLTGMALTTELVALFDSRPEAIALTDYSERILRRTGTLAMDNHPRGDLKLWDWLAVTEVPPEWAAEVRAKAATEAEARRAAERRALDERWSRQSHPAPPVVYGPETDYPPRRPIAKRSMG